MTHTTITNKEIQYLAQLSKLNVSDDEITEVRNRINAVVDMVSQLSEIDTSQVEPLENPTDSVQRLRDDKVTETEDNRKLLMANAPQTEDSLFLVPKVIE